MPFTLHFVTILMKRKQWIPSQCLKNVGMNDKRCRRLNLRELNDEAIQLRTQSKTGQWSRFRRQKSQQQSTLENWNSLSLQRRNFAIMVQLLLLWWL